MLAGRLVNISNCCGRQGLFRVQNAPLRSHFTTSSKQCNAGRAARVADKVGTKPTSLKEKLMAPAGDGGMLYAAILLYLLSMELNFTNLVSCYGLHDLN